MQQIKKIFRGEVFLCGPLLNSPAAPATDSGAILAGCRMASGYTSTVAKIIWVGQAQIWAFDVFEPKELGLFGPEMDF